MILSYESQPQAGRTFILSVSKGCGPIRVTFYIGAKLETQDEYTCPCDVRSVILPEWRSLLLRVTVEDECGASATLSLPIA
jgi:hypothetical protein